MTDPWQEVFEQVPEENGQTRLWMAEPLEEVTMTLEDVERQMHAHANCVDRERDRRQDD
jgi:hypothetical protein